MKKKKEEKGKSLNSWPGGIFLSNELFFLFIPILYIVLFDSIIRGGVAWPCVFPDLTKSEVRSWWANLVKDFVVDGVDGIWNDMDEPVVFKTMPESNIRREDLELGGCQNHS
ncbi:unnamed protein product [Fraxinus pennsylvanica]|uniref:Glycoside hydrolase family 31 TIM barrel domain-containing protein n=1 Tax=Fraxinus pennsylvanica TaxID=56036 RepID=A0AAD2E4B9_9LAMI|nr:unnamed protein product [Fraxinus pennsylvanica]